MIIKPFEPLPLLYSLLKTPQAFVTTQPPTNIASRLPALIIETLGPVNVKNAARPGHGATVTFTVSALAEDDCEARALAESAYSTLWNSINEVTEHGWITNLRDVQAPFLVASDLAANHIFQYTFSMEAVLRK